MDGFMLVDVGATCLEAKAVLASRAEIQTTTVPKRLIVFGQ
jgi:hypothetical protein